MVLFGCRWQKGEITRPSLWAWVGVNKEWPMLKPSNLIMDDLGRFKFLNHNELGVKGPID